MSDLISFYQQQALHTCAASPWAARLQEQALSQFLTLGFPSRHHEDWKYTSLTAFAKHRFSTSVDRVKSAPVKSDSIPITHHPLALVNGCMSEMPSLPAGVIAMPLREAMVFCPEKIEPYLGQILVEQHGFHALNTAMLSTGLFLYVPKDVCVAIPLWLSHWQNVAHHAVHTRHLVVLEEGSSAVLVEDYQGADEVCYFTNTVTEVHLAAHAELTHYKVQREGRGAYHVGHVAVQQSSDSTFTSHSLGFGGEWVRSDTSIALDGVGARCMMNGIYVPTGHQHMDHHTLVMHNASNCHSIQDYKGILSDGARAVFNGRVVVQPGAFQTKAEQQNKNLLLSPDAEIDTKPQLEIFADDVVCTHGATVGQLDEDALFYLATRGIGREEASRYLVHAFLEANWRCLANTVLSEWMGQWVMRAHDE